MIGGRHSCVVDNARLGIVSRRPDSHNNSRRSRHCRTYGAYSLPWNRTFCYHTNTTN